MEESEKSLFLENPETEWQNKQEQKYNNSVKAVESLYDLSLNWDGDEAKIKELCKTIGSWDPFYDHLLGSDAGSRWKIAPQFFETLPIINKMAKVYKNFSEQLEPKNLWLGSPEVMDLSDRARNILYDGLREVNEKTLQELNKNNTKDFFESLKLILTSRLDCGIEDTIGFLNGHKKFFRELSENKNLPLIQEEFNNLQHFLQTRDFEKCIVSAVQEGICTQKALNDGNVARGANFRAEIKHCEPLLKEILSKYGFDADEILDVWSGSHNYFGPQIERNMNTVFNLEDQREGITRLLYKEFGIRNFERYPDSILVKQFDEFNNTEKPYGIMIQATHDWNGAFADWEDREIWEKLFEQIKEQYSFRIAEAKSKQEVARRLIRLNQRYGKQHKISFAFIGGHGSKNSIHFGGPDRRNILSVEDLTGRGLRKTSSFFEPNPTIILVSCSTGAEGGIGQELSKILGAKIIAPSTPTSLKNIETRLTNDGVNFDIEYGLKTEDQDIKKTYMSGEKI